MRRIQAYRCDSVLARYSLLSSCERISFLESEMKQGIRSDCLDSMLVDVWKLTKINPNIIYGSFGSHYQDKAHFKADIAKWRKALNCDDTSK